MNGPKDERFGDLVERLERGLDAQRHLAAARLEERVLEKSRALFQMARVEQEKFEQDAARLVGRLGGASARIRVAG
jgi:hypothetical protein